MQEMVINFLLLTRLQGVPAPAPDRSDVEFRHVVEELAEDINNCALTISTFKDQKWMVKAATSPLWEKRLTKLGTDLIQKRQRINEIIGHYLAICGAETLKEIREIHQEYVSNSSSLDGLILKERGQLQAFP